jgi:hypothetical protein
VRPTTAPVPAGSLRGPVLGGSTTKVGSIFVSGSGFVFTGSRTGVVTAAGAGSAFFGCSFQFKPRVPD